MLIGACTAMVSDSPLQAAADDRVMLSGAAADTSIFTQNNLSFGLMPAAAGYFTSSIDAIYALVCAVAVCCGCVLWLCAVAV